MNEASNFCPYPCADPEGFAKTSGDPPQPPAVRLGSPYAIPGFPADFQPRCVAQVSFNVNASTYYGENIAVLGNAITLGDGAADNSAPMNANNYPIWNVVVDLPTDSTISYQYIRLEEGGDYIYEKTNRTIKTGGCNGTIQVVNDVITTAEGTPPASSASKRSPYDGMAVVDFKTSLITKRQSTTGSMMGLSGRDLINPLYPIHNAAGGISNKTLNTDLVHQDGYVEYDTHNLYGTMMSSTSRDAMLSRRPTVRPIVITRSTFAGAGAHVGHWLGDNVSDWAHYLISITGLMEFASLFQVPMVGSDVCGYSGNTNDLLCARWATLGAFSPFYRNHESSGQIPQEFYRWPVTTQAAQNAIATRYQLLDYIYTGKTSSPVTQWNDKSRTLTSLAALYTQNQTGEPLINPMFFLYPNDTSTFDLQYQYFYGPSVLVAPVTTENSTVGSVYLPKDQFYDFYTHAPVLGTGTTLALPDVPYTTIPLYIKGGSIIPQRATSANTTTELRQIGFNIVIAPGTDGKASGSLYLDDGESLVQSGITFVTLTYENGVFEMNGEFGYNSNDVITSITLLSPSSAASSKREVEGRTTTADSRCNEDERVSRKIKTSVPLTGAYKVKLS